MKKILFIMVLVASVTMTACNSSGTVQNTETTGKKDTKDIKEDDLSADDVDEKGDDSSNDKVEVDLKNTNTVEDVIEYTIKEIETTSKIEPSNASEIYNYYEADDGKILLHIDMDVKNLSSSEVDIYDVMSVSFNIDGEDYNANFAIENNNNFSRATTVKQLMTERVHFFANVPTDIDTDNIVLNIKVADKAYETTFNLDEVALEKVYIKVGEKLTKEDLSEIKIKNIEFTNKLEPSNPGSFYTYYEVKDTANTYLALKVVVKNLKGDSLDADQVMGARLIYDEKYTYNSFSTIEIDGDFKYPTLTSIDPLNKSVMYYIFEVPKEVKEGKVELQINYAGDKYFIEVQ